MRFPTSRADSADASTQDASGSTGLRFRGSGSRPAAGVTSGVASFCRLPCNRLAAAERVRAVLRKISPARAGAIRGHAITRRANSFRCRPRQRHGIVLPVTQGAIEQLRQIVRERIATEGLRPFAARTRVPLGQIRSLLKGRAARYTTLASIASALGLQLYVGPLRQGDNPAPTLPPEITNALHLPLHATVADAIGAIDRDLMAAKLRSTMAVAGSLTEKAAEAAAVIPDLVAGTSPRARRLPLVHVRRPQDSGAVRFDESTHLSILVSSSVLPSRKQGDRLACLQAWNEVTEPRIRSGDLVVLDLDQSLPQDDQLYAVATPEGLVVNRLRQIDGQWHRFDDTTGRSARPMHPQDTVVGRLVWCESPDDFNES